MRDKCIQCGQVKEITHPVNMDFLGMKFYVCEDCKQFIDKQSEDLKKAEIIYK